MGAAVSTAASASSAAPTPSRVWLAFVSCCTIWGSTFLVISFGNDALPPVWASGIRLAIASVLLTLWCTLARIPLPRGAALKSALIYGVLNFGFNFPLLYWGERTVPSGLAAVMYSTTPLTTALLARALGIEQLTPAKIMGSLVALVGVVVLFSGSLRGQISPLGLLSVFMAATLAATGATLYKRGPRQNAVATNAVACAIGAVIALALSFLIREPHVIPRTAAALIPLAYLVLAGSLGAFVIFTWLVTHWPVSRAAYIGVVVPVIAVILGSVVRHERLTLGEMGGSVLVIAGLVIGMRGAKSAH
jgi:drug/metabolite transporter (DMT)-like permease